MVVGASCGGDAFHQQGLGIWWMDGWMAFHSQWLQALNTAALLLLWQQWHQFPDGQRTRSSSAYAELSTLYSDLKMVETLNFLQKFRVCAIALRSFPANVLTYIQKKEVKTIQPLHLLLNPNRSDIIHDHNMNKWTQHFIFKFLQKKLDPRSAVLILMSCTGALNKNRSQASHMNSSF